MCYWINYNINNVIIIALNHVCCCYLYFNSNISKLYLPSINAKNIFNINNFNEIFFKYLEYSPKILLDNVRNASQLDIWLLKFINYFNGGYKNQLLIDKNMIFILKHAIFYYYFTTMNEYGKVKLNRFL